MKKIICLLLITVLLCSALPSFAVGASYEEMASMLHDLDIFHGDGSGYNFEGYLTRAQFTKLAIVASPYKNSVPSATKTSPFSDVKYTHWAAGYIKAATSNSVIMGYPDSTFKPEGKVKTEEAVTILLKLMGYTNADFGNEWPYGQMSIAANIGLTDNVTKAIGDNLQRKDAVALIYNMLNMNSKDGSSYIGKLSCKLIEDVVIIASSREDTTIDSDKVYTSQGLMKISDSFDSDNVGRTGDIVVQTASNRILSFIPSAQSLKTYTVDSIRGEDIWIYENGTAKLLNAQSNTTVYEKRNSYSLGNFVSQIDSGDEVTVVTNENGYISYLLVNLNETLAFSENTSEVYAVTAVLGSSIIVSDKGSNKTLDFPSSTTAYYNSSKTTFSNLSNMASAGDLVSVVRDANGEIRYVSIDSSKLEGPYTAKSSSIFESFGISSDAVILKNGAKVSASDISANDIIYYSSTLNTVWVYSDKKTGIYESASPNAEFPTSITLSGKSYTIESSAAFSKLASGGSFSQGSTVTLLLGRNGEIADVVSLSSQDTVYGYVLNAGKGNFENSSGSSYTSYFVEIVTPDGFTNEYTTEKDCSGLRSKVSKITFKNSYAVLSAINTESNIGGLFDLSNYKFGSSKLAKTVNIIDVKKSASNRNGEFVRIYPSRLDGITINKSKVLYAHKNSNNEIDELILEDVTGDTYSYGIVITNDVNKGGSYILNGNTSSIKSGFTIKNSTPAKFGFEGNSLETAEPLISVGESIISINETALSTKSGKKFYLSDKVCVYKYVSASEYMMIPLSDIINSEEYTLSAYYDKATSSGGRIRIIIAR